MECKYLLLFCWCYCCNLTKLKYRIECENICEYVTVTTNCQLTSFDQFCFVLFRSRSDDDHVRNFNYFCESQFSPITSNGFTCGDNVRWQRKKMGKYVQIKKWSGWRMLHQIVEKQKFVFANKQPESRETWSML